MNRIIETTDDGFNTLYIPEMNEHYHSVKGAYTESKHIFIDMGLNCSQKKSLKILEVGFGTGLNAILSIIEADKNNRQIEYHALELYPLDTETISSLNHTKFLDGKYGEIYIRMHSSEWGKTVRLTENFNINKIKCNFTEINSWWDGSKYDIVYFDAFAPEKEPEMWHISLLEKIYEMMSTNGIFVTYCAKGCIRRSLQSCGFKVERLPGPPGGKREILRAIKV